MSSRRFKRRAIIIAAAALLVATAGGVIFLRGHRAATLVQVPFSDLLRHLDSGAVAAVVVNGDTLDVTLANGQTFRTIAPANYVTANAAFVAPGAR